MNARPPEPIPGAANETPPMPKDPNALVEIAQCLTEFEAGALAATLEAEGIPARVFGGMVAAGFGWQGAQATQVLLLVRRADVQAARAVLDALEPADEAEPLDEPPDHPHPDAEPVDTRRNLPDFSQPLPYGPDSHYIRASGTLVTGVVWTAVAFLLAVGLIAAALYLLTGL